MIALAARSAVGRVYAEAAFESSTHAHVTALLPVEVSCVRWGAPVSMPSWAAHRPAGWQCQPSATSIVRVAYRPAHRRLPELLQATGCSPAGGCSAILRR